MTAAVVALSIACCVLALCYLPAAVGVAFLWWRVQRLEAQLEKLDEVVAELLGGLGLGSGGEGRGGGHGVGAGENGRPAEGVSNPGGRRV